jgi:hypothetical protein
MQPDLRREAGRQGCCAARSRTPRAGRRSERGQSAARAALATPRSRRRTPAAHDNRLDRIRRHQRHFTFPGKSAVHHGFRRPPTTGRIQPCPKVGHGRPGRIQAEGAPVIFVRSGSVTPLQKAARRFPRRLTREGPGANPGSLPGDLPASFLPIPSRSGPLFRPGVQPAALSDTALDRKSRLVGIKATTGAPEPRDEHFPVPARPAAVALRGHCSILGRRCRGRSRRRIARVLPALLTLAPAREAPKHHARPPQVAECGFRSSPTKKPRSRS